ncbi:hypothetical protein IQ255_11815 [Pleurocapsales cyanobacterium LEGE 10410]|nr:hypothetical protein [Pleurocapsales cyanobacterium LEGE 10410]
MATALQRLKNWIFESRSFLFSWYTKDRDRLQEPTKSLVELPPVLRKKLTIAAQKLPNDPVNTETIRSLIDEAFEQWRDRETHLEDNLPKNAENSVVIVTNPVMVVSRIVIEIIEAWATQKQVTVKILPWNSRPADPDSIQSKLQHYIEQDPADAAKKTEVMVIPNLSWCFLRAMDGLDGIDYLQKMLLHDSSRFWIIAAGQVTWDYLNSISDLEADCGRVSSLPKLESDSLCQWLAPIISELDITFADPRLESKILDADKDAETIYFEDLASISQGVSVIALHTFLASVTYEPSEEDEPGILEAQNPELPNLPELTSTDHYLLYFLLLHGDITLSALAHSLGDRESRVRKRIKILRNEGLVEENGEVLKINPIYYPKLKQELINNNFVINEFE